MKRGTWRNAVSEATTLAVDSLRTEWTRSVLAVAGIVIGIVTVVLVASVLANVRNQIALLFRDLGTENVFAFHLTGDPYVAASDDEAQRLPLELGFVDEIRRLSTTSVDGSLPKNLEAKMATRRKKIQKARVLDMRRQGRFPSPSGEGRSSRLKTENDGLGFC